ncbi:hypothetical protein ACG33_04040 [Steroidobacter denitrificans]|uniref:Chemotaxis protein n=1 Tax=Steroidobacter denitrificans TaxID=465721 RepID=A0A127F9Q2_STEDE|nr:hypothetical protein [Steroidobacter denitrificans]AMN46289.1 hypothetical protein ACG33_04040 [Steroidobacter denitrificans]
MNTSELGLPSSLETRVRTDDWSPEQQIVRLLELCEAQIGAAMHDAETAIDTLLQAFNAVSETSRSMRASAGELQDTLHLQGIGNLNRQFDAIRSQMNSAVIALQFHDKLTQRLDHVRHSLLRLAAFTCDRTQRSQRKQWDQLLISLRQLYRTEEEQQIFRRLIEDSVDSAAPAEPQHDIELF